MRKTYDRLGLALPLVGLLPGFAAMLVHRAFVLGPILGVAAVLALHRLFNTGAPDVGPEKSDVEQEKRRTALMNDPAVFSLNVKPSSGGLAMPPTADIRATGGQRFFPLAWLAVLGAQFAAIIGLSDKVFPGQPIDYAHWRLMLACTAAVFIADLVRRLARR